MQRNAEVGLFTKPSSLDCGTDCMLGLSMMILESRCLAEIHDRWPDNSFIDSYMMWENTERGLGMLLFTTKGVTNPGNWEDVH